MPYFSRASCGWREGGGGKKITKTARCSKVLFRIARVFLEIICKPLKSG